MSNKIVHIAAVATILLSTASATLAAPRHHVRTAPAASATVRNNNGNSDYSAFAASRTSGTVRTPAAAQRIPEPTYFGLAAGVPGQSGDN